MDKGRFLVAIVLIIGMAALIKGFIRDVQKNRPVPTKYILYFDARINENQNGMKVTNQNDFPWPDPVFFINRTYRFDYKGAVLPGQVLDLSFKDFKNEPGQSFPGVAQFHDFDIRTATMAQAKHR